MLFMTGSCRMATIRVTLDTLHSLLLGLTLACRVLCLQSLLFLVADLTSVLPVDIRFHGLGAHIDTLVVLSHRKVRLCLTQVCSDKLGVALDSLVAIRNGRRERKELDEAGSTVGVATCIVGCTLDHLAVGFDSRRPICFLELRVPKRTCLLSLLWVDVCVLVCRDLGLFCRAKLGEHFRCSVLGLCLLVEEDGVGEVALFLVRGTDTGKRLCNDLEVGQDLAAVLYGLLAGLDAAWIVALLELGGSEVGEVGDVLVRFPCLGVVLDGWVELSLFVELCAFLLLLIRLGLGLLCGLLFLSLFYGFRFRCRLFLRCGSCVRHIDILLRFARVAGCLCTGRRLAE
ncbi:hypothetical protein P280DRAFT_176184 [Massarina eburnea CBS 473.64]|uniref:Uncharacterized protein n=1 Tax=Massarina eburnea CBS 473.64 TaxID=1395130 RepID=A0A6A6SE11_9PLEO|nr:hypothetical protein P280DRAFT_176184 [Massarina eburnea CBS 473.64]